VPVPRPASGEVQVRNLWMTVDPYMRGRMADRAIYARSSSSSKEVREGVIGEIAASNSTMYGWRPGLRGRGSAGGRRDRRSRGFGRSPVQARRPRLLLVRLARAVQCTCGKPAEARHFRAPAPGIPGSRRHARADGLGRHAQDRGAKTGRRGVRFSRLRRLSDRLHARSRSSRGTRS
jgi:hypothetical protein